MPVALWPASMAHPQEAGDISGVAATYNASWHSGNRRLHGEEDSATRAHIHRRKSRY